jgi:DNA-binding transcriptional LysR family regulator
MQAFVRVVEAGGIGNAAEQMSIAKSAVSRRLSELETRLGVTLINRTTRTQKLTDTGEQYYQRSLQIINEMTELNNITADPECALHGTLRISAPLSFGLLHLTPALDSFIKEHPQLTLDVDFNDHQLDLIGGGFDLAFRIGDLDDSTLKARLICPIHFTVCASPKYLSEHGTPQHPDDLKQHQVLKYSLYGSNAWTFLDKAGEKQNVTTNPRIAANNGDFLSDMAVANHGIIINPTFISWRAVSLGELVPILEDYSIPSVNAYAVYPQSRQLSRRTRLLIDFLVERFGNNPYWDQI